MIKRWPYHVVTTRRHQDKPSTKGLNDKLRVQLNSLSRRRSGSSRAYLNCYEPPPGQYP
jgi:hypothetical protein